MSRVARRPIALPAGVEVKISETEISIKGPKGSAVQPADGNCTVRVEDNVLNIGLAEGAQNPAMAGTLRAILANHVTGVSEGFSRSLELIGVGYRAQAQGKNLNLSLGFSHPVVFESPEGITIETPSQTEIVIRGADAQKVGQVAANIRAFRPPEPYKGKGVRYKGERVLRKEAKKK
ncbi:MAG: 50S ribosomal protein L6 [Thioalkalivibrionaceae bacterium]